MPAPAPGPPCRYIIAGLPASSPRIRTKCFAPLISWKRVSSTGPERFSSAGAITQPASAPAAPIIPTACRLLNILRLHELGNEAPLRHRLARQQRIDLAFAIADRLEDDTRMLAQRGTGSFGSVVHAG